jgi:type I restriction enzyme M protein
MIKMRKATDLSPEKIDQMQIGYIFKELFRIGAERDENGKPVVSAKGKNKGKPDADPDLRDTENVPLKEKVGAYFKREVLPHVPDTWIDYDKTKIGYEIPLNRYFYKYKPPRKLKEIEVDIRGLETEIVTVLAEVTGSSEGGK